MAAGHGAGLYLATSAGATTGVPVPSIRLGRRHGRKGGQIRFTHHQSSQLEETFASQRYLTPGQRRSLANRLALTERQVPESDFFSPLSLSLSLSFSLVSIHVYTSLWLYATPSYHLILPPIDIIGIHYIRMME